MKRSKHSLSHYKLLTCDMGELIPLTWYEGLPGDTIQQSTSALIRCSPLLAPVMHPVRVRLHHFSVPIRLIWDDWEDFVTGGPDGTSTPTHPYKALGGVTEGTLYDYLGYPVGTYAGTENMSALPLRAYQLIFNEYYRDQDLVTASVIDTTSGSDTTTDWNTKKVAWEKDYFTSARPWEQKGSTVTIPLGTTAPVQSKSGDTGIPLFDASISGTTGLTSDSGDNFVDATASANGTFSWNDPQLETDLSSATGIDINDLRLALALQRYQERMAKYGSRYVEYLRQLGIRSSDARLQNPEYLGGGRQTIQFSEVLSTDSGGSDPVGDMKGHGITGMRTNRYRRFFEEHSIVMTMLSVVPKAIYTQGLQRKFLRTVKEDYFQKELQFIGEQEILNKEVYAEHATPDGVFGYQSRYDEYRTHPSTIAGEFHSTNDHWHYGRIFASDPSLNSTFVSATPTKRVNASSSTDCLYVMANHSIQARRIISSVARNRTF